jgi:hypothetical protein
MAISIFLQQLKHANLVAFFTIFIILVGIIGLNFKFRVAAKTLFEKYQSIMSTYEDAKNNLINSPKDKVIRNKFLECARARAEIEQEIAKSAIAGFNSELNELRLKFRKNCYGEMQIQTELQTFTDGST